MRAITTYDKEAVEELNNYPLVAILQSNKELNRKLEINNGRITGATITHRDYVSVYDGRNNYI